MVQSRSGCEESILNLAVPYPAEQPPLVPDRSMDLHTFSGFPCLRNTAPYVSCDIIASRDGLVRVSGSQNAAWVVHFEGAYERHELAVQRRSTCVQHRQHARGGGGDAQKGASRVVYRAQRSHLRKPIHSILGVARNIHRQWRTPSVSRPRGIRSSSALTSSPRIPRRHPATPTPGPAMLWVYA